MKTASKFCASAVIVTALMGLSPETEAESVFYLSSELGISRITLGDEYKPFSPDDGYSLIGAHVAAGYQMDSWLLEMGGGYTGNLGFLAASDDIELKSWHYGVGLPIRLDDRFNLVAKTGRYHWRLRLQEGLLLNPGPEADASFEESDWFFALDAEFFTNERFALVGSLFYSNTEFGSVNSYQIGAQFNF